MSINNKAELYAAISELEKKKLFQEEALIAQYKVTRESLTPLNLIKDGFNMLIQVPGIQNDILKTVAGMGVAFLSKKLLVRNSSSLLRKAFTTVVEFAVAKSTISNADKIKAYAVSVYNNLFKGNKEQEQTGSE